MARLLTPEEFGLIGMITIFIAVSQTFIDSGFSQALIRKPDCRNEDYSTMFFFNLAVGIVFYIILFASAPMIGGFFKEPRLVLILRVLGLALTIESFGLIERTILTKRMNFKLQTKISLISSGLSGVIAITLAYLGWGVWSLVAKTITQNLFNSILLWIWNRWEVKFVFDTDSFKEMAGFGSKLLGSGLIYTLYRNAYYIVIGKYFSAMELGYFTRAEQFQNLPSQNLSTIIERVSYPALSHVGEDAVKLKAAFKRLIKDTMYISFICMLGLAAVAKPLIVVLIGSKWLPAVPLLQLLCFSGMFYPLHSLNLNMLKVKGRSDLFLILEIIKTALAVPVILIGIFFGIKAMIIGMIVDSIIAYYLNSYWSGKLVNYPIWEQMKDIAPSFFLAAFVGGATYLFGTLFSQSSLLPLVLETTIGAGLAISVSNLFKMDEYFEIKNIIEMNFLGKRLRTE